MNEELRQRRLEAGREIHTEQWPGGPDEGEGRGRPADALMVRVWEWIRQVALPESTYRLQFHRGFTFRDAAAVVPYLAELGVTHVYASPYLKATPGSTHGYDVVDHCELNPELGSREEYEAFVQVLKDHGMGQILDTVPNHVGIGTNENLWWNEVLENGRASRYGRYFDIAWEASPRKDLRNRVLLPVLGDLYGKVLERGELKLAFEAERGCFAIWYYEHRYPVAMETYGLILEEKGERGKEKGEEGEYQSILLAIGNLPRGAGLEEEQVVVREGEKEVIKRRLAELVRRSARVRERVERAVEAINGRVGEPESFDRLDKLMRGQHYRLCYWRNAAEELNYRRFFDVNTLAALAMERPDVFEETHRLTLELLAKGEVAGLRVDHPDGLYDPAGYFARLQKAYVLAVARELAGGEWERLETAVRGRLAGEELRGWRGGGWPLYVVAEKILALEEPLPEEWAVYGTSGYDFLNMVNEVFVDQASEGAMTRLYEQVTGDRRSFEQIVYEKKRLILDRSLSSELQMLADELGQITQKDRRWSDFTLQSLRLAVREVIACMGVYRTYISEAGVHGSDRAVVEEATRKAMERNPRMSEALFACIRDVLLQRYPAQATAEDRAEYLRFAGRFQQLTSPATAKGVEDTAFYVYRRLISLNEVGGDPGRFGISVAEFHQYQKARQEKWPYSLSSLSTHDTKRSEDVRARINVLSEMPELWGEHVLRWREINRQHRRGESPGADEEYLLYQTLIGAWPMERAGEEFVRRIQAYMLKAMREAKQRTTWTDPDEGHEKAVAEFVERVLDANSSGAFLSDFVPFQRMVSHFGTLNSLAQTVLRLTCPGVPDTYQGSEVWDLSLVDPDNRRRVDYGVRQEMLGAVAEVGVETLLNAAWDGRVKLRVMRELLQLRRANPGLLLRGEYVPLAVTGECRQHVIAYLRRSGREVVMVMVPRLMYGLLGGETGWPVGQEVWRDTYVRSAEGLPEELENVLTGQRVKMAGAGVAVGEVLGAFPVGVMRGRI